MKTIINKIFPETLNNDYKGYRLALYVFYALTIFTLWRSQHHLLAADGGAQSIASIPLDSFTNAGTAAVIGVFSLWGLSQLIISILYLIVGLRYRAMLPLMYLLMVLEYLVRATYIPLVKPIPTIGTAPGAVGNLPLIILLLVMLTLTILEPRE
jgi:hypothetical protein